MNANSPFDFAIKSEETVVQSLIDTLPSGDAWTAKNVSTSNFYKSLVGLSQEWIRLQSTLYDIASSLVPQVGGSTFVQDWETLLGIPDECFLTNTGDNIERTRNIIIKLGYLGLVTEEDYLRLANILNLTIVVSNSQVATPGFPYIFSFTLENVLENSNNLIITITDNGTDDVELFQCLVSTYKEAFVNVTFIVV